jgi:RNA polymerase sigma-70 factor (ECF subfamily)
MMASRTHGSTQDASVPEAVAARARFLRADGMIEDKPQKRGLAKRRSVLACASPVEHGFAPTALACGHARTEVGRQRMDHAQHGGNQASTLADIPRPAQDLDRVRARIVGDLYASWYHRVFGFVRRVLGDEEAEEVAHEAFVRLLRVRNLERMNISVAYLLRIAENLIRRRHGRAQRYREVLELSGRMVPEAERHEASQCVSDGTRDGSWSTLVDCDRIHAALRLLTPSEQTAVRLIVCEGLDYQAAARSLGVPVSTINNWKHRALVKLKQLIESEGLAFQAGRRAAG